MQVLGGGLEDNNGVQKLITEIKPVEKIWTSRDFVLHAYGKGDDVTLTQIGHLEQIISRYYSIIKEGDKTNMNTLQRINAQILEKVYKTGEGEISYSFEGTYDFSNIAYAHGSATVSGVFVGNVERNGDKYLISGHIRYYFYDEYTDQFRIRDRLLGDKIPAAQIDSTYRNITDGLAKVYRITDSWETEYHAVAPIYP